MKPLAITALLVLPLCFQARQEVRPESPQLQPITVKLQNAEGELRAGVPGAPIVRSVVGEDGRTYTVTVR